MRAIPSCRIASHGIARHRVFPKAPDQARPRPAAAHDLGRPGQLCSSLKSCQYLMRGWAEQAGLGDKQAQAQAQAGDKQAGRQTGRVRQAKRKAPVRGVLIPCGS